MKRKKKRPARRASAANTPITIPATAPDESPCPDDEVADELFSEPPMAAAPPEELLEEADADLEMALLVRIACDDIGLEAGDVLEVDRSGDKVMAEEEALVVVVVVVEEEDARVERV